MIGSHSFRASALRTAARSGRRPLDSECIGDASVAGQACGRHDGSGPPFDRLRPGR